MISWGLLGLLDAIETYDPSRRTKLESYAISKIRWAVLDRFRSQDWVPRRVRLCAQEIERATVRLTQKLWRSPTEAEIVDEMGVSITKYRSFLGQWSRARVTSWEARSEIDSKRTGIEYEASVEDPLDVDPQTQANLEELRAHLVDAISELEERERLVATFYVYQGLTPKEIGRALNLTAGRISQILSGALAKLRESLRGASSTYGGWQENLMS